MGLSNAERQQRFRERQKAKHEARIRELEAELRKAPTNTYEIRFSNLRAKIARARNNPVEKKDVDRLWKRFVDVNLALEGLEECAGVPDLTKRRAKVQALVERPGTEGGRAAAAAAAERPEKNAQVRPSRWVKPRPTKAEMLANKGRPRTQDIWQ